jgi:CheY-like chemotaxis protein
MPRVDPNLAAPGGRDARPLIVVVDDDPDILQMLHGALVFAGYHTVLCQRGTEAYRLIRQLHPDLVILDLWLESRHSGEIILDVLKLDPRTRAIPVIVCSGHVPILKAMARVLQERGCVVLAKRFSLDALLGAVLGLIGPPSVA